MKQLQSQKEFAAQERNDCLWVRVRLCFCVCLRLCVDDTRLLDVSTQWKAQPATTAHTSTDSKGGTFALQRGPSHTNTHRSKCVGCVLCVRKMIADAGTGRGWKGRGTITKKTSMATKKGGGRE
jgi:hypothetical protein